MATPSSPTPSSGAKPAYFTDPKKGEVNELRLLLRTVNTEKDPKKKQDVIKRVIAYMTLGIDVSPLFSEMVLCVESRDLVVKKMVYLYLTSYAQEHPDMALMCVNTVHRDCNDIDPMVRGLALRSLCSLRLPSMSEYMCDPIRKSLSDPNAYVRKTAVMGVLKLFNLQPDMVKDSNLVDQLYAMIEDPDGGVSANCIMVLNEVLLNSKDGAGGSGLVLNQPLVHHLLGRLNDFNEWGLHHVLELLVRYEPYDEQEVFSVMNLLDPVLRTSNSAVVLATIKAFLHLTKAMPHVHRQLFERVKAPVLTLLGQGGSQGGGGSEVVYCMLKHTQLLVQRCPGIFDDDYKQFFTKYSEPLHVKYLKVDLLAELTNAGNAAAVLEELAEYVSEVDAELARRAIRAIGKVAARLPAGLEQGPVDRLVELLDLSQGGYVQAECLLVLKDLLRKFPARRHSLLPRLPRLVREVEEPLARAALLWSLGEFGTELPEAPYLLEPLVGGYEEEASAAVKLALLTCAVKLFFKRPPEVKPVLGKLLSVATSDAKQPDVRDRALLYYRLLKHDTDACQRVVALSSHRADLSRLEGPGFAEATSSQVQDALFAEFNTLSVVYGKLQRTFIAPDKRSRESASGSSGSSASTSSNGGVSSAAVGSNEAAAAAVVESASSTPHEDSAQFSDVGAATYGAPVDLLGTGVDLLGGLSVDEPAPAMTSSLLPSSSLALAPAASISGERFQELWAEWSEAPDGSSVKQCINCGAGCATATAEVVDVHLAQHKVFTMASGDLPDSVKLFLYAQRQPVNGGAATGESGIFLCECTLTPSTRAASAVVKAAPRDAAEIPAFWGIVQASLEALPAPTSGSVASLLG